MQYSTPVTPSAHAWWLAIEAITTGSRITERLGSLWTLVSPLAPSRTAASSRPQPQSAPELVIASVDCEPSASAATGPSRTRTAGAATLVSLIAPDCAWRLSPQHATRPSARRTQLCPAKVPWSVGPGPPHARRVAPAAPSTARGRVDDGTDGGLARPPMSLLPQHHT